MRIDARKDVSGWAAFDLDKGEKIPLCIWADDETCEYEHYVPNDKGQPRLDPSNPRQVLTHRGQGRIVLIPPGGSLPVIVEKK